LRVAVWHNLPSGGGKRALYNHVKVLKEYGHYLEAWTTDMSSEDYLPLSDLITENRKSVKLKFDSLNNIENPITRERKKIKLLESHCKECVKEIEKKKFDLIFAGSCLFSYMPYIGSFTRLPKIVYIGEPFRYLYEAMPDNIWQAPYPEIRIKKIKRLISDYKINYSRRIKVRREIEAADSYNKILVNSLFSRENVIRSYGTDATVCYLGIDTENFKPVSEKKENYVVGLGKISYLKSVQKAIEIVATIPAGKRPSLKWVSNGSDSNYLDETVALARELDVDYQIYLNVADCELTQIVSKASIMIYTSRLEPFGLAPLEANACGTYVVAVAEGGVRESITNGVNGTLINGYRINEFTDVIGLFTSDLEFSRKKGLEARKFVEENWNYKFMAENLLREVDDLAREFNIA
jgi:glycosyltransferase involved in cell wall biosynthesis